jgi:uncharacterized protein
MRRFRFAQTLAAEVGGRELRVWVAASFPQRLLGLAWLPGIPACRALLIPNCAAVHTWGMRFPLDIAFLEWPPPAHGSLLRVHAAVPPRRAERIARAAGRTAVLEAPAGTLAPGYPAVTFKSCLRAT